MIATEFDLTEFIEGALMEEQEPAAISRALIAAGVKLPVPPTPRHTCDPWWNKAHGADPTLCKACDPNTTHACTEWRELYSEAYGAYRACEDCGHQTATEGGEL